MAASPPQERMSASLPRIVSRISGLQRPAWRARRGKAQGPPYLHYLPVAAEVFASRVSVGRLPRHLTVAIDSTTARAEDHQPIPAQRSLLRRALVKDVQRVVRTADWEIHSA